jgi:hypothetical protein
MTAAEIAAVLGDGRREGRSWRCRCPLHGGRSLTLRDGGGGLLLVTCWAGCDRLDLLAELRRRGLLDGDRRRGGRENLLHRDHLRHQNQARDDDACRIARALSIWNATLPAARSPVASYLAGRGITPDPWPASLRWHPRCPRPHGAAMPAMVAVVEHVARGIVGVHRTYITPDHRRHDRAALGPVGGGAVWLGMPRVGNWLAIGEGIESTAAAVVACGMPGWAALSAGGMRALVLPPEATHVLICADNDASGTGARAAHAAAARWLAEGRRVRIAMPAVVDTDMADALTGDDTDTTADLMELRHVA